MATISTQYNPLQQDMQAVFPFLLVTQSLLLIKFCFASLLYHKSFMSTNLGARSPFRTNPIVITRLNLGSSLRSTLNDVLVKFAWEDTEIYLTGIPPHVMLFVNCKLIMHEVQKVHSIQMTKMQDVSNQAVAAIRADLDERAIGGGQVTVNRFEAMLAPLNQRIETLAQTLSVTSSVNASSRQESQVTEQIVPTQYLKYRWGQDNKWRRLPEGYKFNRKLTPLHVWQLWHHGDEVAPPLKLIDQLDICDSAPDRKGKLRPKRDTEVRTYWNLKYLCNALDEAGAIRRGTSPSISELTTLYNSEEVNRRIPSNSTALNRERRTNELNWDYAVVVMREEKKRRIH